MLELVICRRSIAMKLSREREDAARLEQITYWIPDICRMTGRISDSPVESNHTFAGKKRKWKDFRTVDTSQRLYLTRPTKREEVLTILDTKPLDA